MTWVFASFLMFVCSIVTYLLVRKLSKDQVPVPLINLAMFLVPFLVYLFLTTQIPTNFHLSLWQLSVIAFSAIFFSFLGNMLHLKSIELAANPGYSLLIAKSYAVYTSIAAIWLFNAKLPWEKAIAIVAIIAGMAILTINPASQAAKPHKTKKTTSTSWIWLAFGAFFCFGSLSLTSKYLQTIGVGVLERLVVLLGIVTWLTIIDVRVKKLSLKSLSKSQLGIFVLIGLFAAGFNYFMQEAIITAPNIGYVNAINASSTAAITVLSAAIYKDELNLKKLLGVLVVIGGLVGLVY